MGVNIGVATYITILMIALMAIGFIGQARQDAKAKKLDKQME
jgi:hypothetical protein